MWFFGTMQPFNIVNSEPDTKMLLITPYKTQDRLNLSWLNQSTVAYGNWIPGVRLNTVSSGGDIGVH